MSIEANHGQRKYFIGSGEDKTRFGKNPYMLSTEKLELSRNYVSQENTNLE